MDSLGEDLVLLSVRHDSGTVATAQRIGYGLMGAELVRLAASGRAGLADGRIVVLSQAPTGDPQLDAALGSLLGARRPPRAASWVGRPRPGIRALSNRYQITDPARLADAAAQAAIQAAATQAAAVAATQAASRPPAGGHGGHHH